MTREERGGRDRVYRYHFDLVRVIDGDTVVIDVDLGFHHWIKNLRVRLDNIDTPELRSSNPLDAFFAIRARQRVEELIQHCTQFVSNGDAGKYGRWLGDFEFSYAAEELPSDHVTLSERLIYEAIGVRYLNGQGMARIDKEDRKALYRRNELLWPTRPYKWEHRHD